MTAEDYLKGLNEHSVIFERNIDPEYSERQLILFAQNYHNFEMKKLNKYEGEEADIIKYSTKKI